MTTPDPFEHLREQLIHDLAFGDWEDNYEGWEDTKARLAEISPRDGTKYEIIFPSPARATPSVEMACPDCGKVIRSSGGISWISEEEEAKREYPLVMNVHWSNDCPAWKNRAWRIWHIHCREIWIWIRHPIRKYRWWKLGR